MNVDGVYNFIIPSGFQIRVSYYSGGVEAQFFVFDAVGANKTGWFSRHRLLETSYDITAFANTIGIFGEYFSLEGKNYFVTYLTTTRFILFKTLRHKMEI